MYPIGSNGASQAILDARAWPSALATDGPIADALAAYEAERRPATTAHRARQPRQRARSRSCSWPRSARRTASTDVHDVIPREELEAIAAAYKRLAGFAPEQVNRGHTPAAR